MRIGKTLPPATNPISMKDIWDGLAGLFQGQNEIDRFEKEVRDFFMVNYCICLSSGKAALTTILRALHKILPSRNDVIIPAYTCYSVPASIIRAGLNIVLCDLNLETLDYDFKQLEEIVSTKKTSLLCILSTHLFGKPADVEHTKSILKNGDTFVVEDAAQAMGGIRIGKPLGTIGDVGFFSLGRGKPFSCVEGGIILTNRDDIAEQIKCLSKDMPSYNYSDLGKLFITSFSLLLFQHPMLFWLPKSLPFLKLGETIYDPCFKIKKLSSFQAGLTKKWQTKLTNQTKQRSEKTKKWADFLKGKIDFYCPDRENIPYFTRLPIINNSHRQRKQFLDESERYGYGIMPSYPDSINNINEIKHYFDGADFPEAQKLSDTLFTLPLHQFVTDNDMKKIAAVLTKK